jgi:hypothetical protein
MNTAISSVRISSSPGSVSRGLRLTITAWIRARRQPLTREELVDLVEMRRMAERLREERASVGARMGRVLG